jgi:phosphotransferase system HPr (HPr) family protein
MAAWRKSSGLHSNTWWARRQDIETIAIGPDDRMENRRADIAEAVARVNGGQGVIILTDMFGGTPSNLAISLLEIGKVEVVAGLNLPMLVKLARIRKDYAAGQGGRRPHRMPAANTSTSPARSWETRRCRRRCWPANVAITNQRGLHARASAKFVKCAESYDADITVSRDGMSVPATSIMGLMMLGAAMGTSIMVEARGREAETALEALAQLVESKFDEE